MDLKLAIQWINSGIIDFNQMILQNYKGIGLNETEAFLLIELQKQAKAGNTFLNPKNIIKNVSLSMDVLLQELDQLIKNGFLKMEFVMNEAGKEIEVFDLNGTVEKILKYNHQLMDELVLNQPKTYATSEEELVDLIETQFQKQLTPLEIEIIRKWIGEDRYSILNIKKALMDAVKANKASLSYVDRVLSKRAALENKPKEVKYSEEPEALKTFFESWPKK